ncbi:MAG: ferritin-like domain-containing protein [Polyangiaceae bacterium]
MASMGTGEPAKQPPPSAYDKNGCLPANKVTNSCCNAASRGPVFSGGKCCYDFPQGTALPCCGRPFLVEGRARVASVDGSPTQFAASSVERARAVAARTWSQAGQFEHASVASFLRFALELLSFGAPLDLVEAALRAADDEVRHAELCFGIAERLDGGARAPSRFDLSGGDPRADVATVVGALVLEGCVGETIAAVLASREQARTTDDAIRTALTEIAADEARHAELAWRSLRWACEAFGDVARDAAAAAFQTAEREVARPARLACDSVDDDALRDYGRSPERDEQLTAAEVWARVVTPCRRALSLTA